MAPGRGKNRRFGAGAGKKVRVALLGSALRTRVKEGRTRHAGRDAAESAGALSHVDAEGHARMVDVSAKAVTAREATAREQGKESNHRDADQPLPGEDPLTTAEH